MSHEHPPTAHGPEASHKEGQPTEAEKIEKFKTLPEEEKRRKIETIPKKPGETDEEHLRRKEEYLKAGSDEEYKKVLEELLHPDGTKKPEGAHRGEKHGEEHSHGNEFGWEKKVGIMGLGFLTMVFWGAVEGFKKGFGGGSGGGGHSKPAKKSSGGGHGGGGGGHH